MILGVPSQHRLRLAIRQHRSFPELWLCITLNAFLSHYFAKGVFFSYKEVMFFSKELFYDWPVIIYRNNIIPIETQLYHVFQHNIHSIGREEVEEKMFRRPVVSTMANVRDFFERLKKPHLETVRCVLRLWGKIMGQVVLNSSTKFNLYINFQGDVSKILSPRRFTNRGLTLQSIKNLWLLYLLQM